MLKNVMQKVEVHNSLRLDVMHSLGFNVIYTFGDFIFNFFLFNKTNICSILKKKKNFFSLHYFLSQAVSWYITLLLMLFWQK